MTVIADLCVVPLGVGVSVSTYVAACEKVLGADGAFPVRVERIHETTPQKKVLTWELWVMKNGLRVFFLKTRGRAKVTSKQEPQTPDEE